jgi:WD40 repeat protein
MVVAAGNAKGYVTIWDANTGERREQLKIGAMPIRVVEFSADGTTMVVAESGQGVTIWRGQPLREVKAIRMDGLITSMRLSRCGKYVAVAKSDGTLGIWEVETATLTRSLEEVTGWINCLAFSDDGSVLAAAGADYTVALWEWRKGRLLNPRRGHGGRITAIAFAPEKVVTAGTDFAVYGWDMKGTIKDVIKAPGTRDRALAPMMARGRSVLAVSRETSRVDVYEFPAMRRLFTMPIDNMAVEALALTVDDQVLAVGGQIIRDGRPESVVKLFKASSGKLSHEIRPESELVTSLRFSPGGDNLIVRHSTRTEVWDVLTRQRRYTLRHAIASIMAADCGPKDDWFVIDDPFTASVEMRSFKDGSQMQRFGGVNTGILVQSVAVAPDGRLVATGSARGTIDLWNVASGEKVGTFSSQNGGVIRTLCFSDDGSMLASGSDDTTVLLWDVKVYQKPDR